MIRSTLRVPIRAHGRLPLYCLLVLFPAVLAFAALHAESGQAANAQKSLHTVPELLDKDEILRRISVFEDLARRADSLHIDQQSLIKIYRNLATLYYLAGMMPGAEAATQRAIELMKDGTQEELADEYNLLSSIHGLLGNFKQAEKDQMQALAVREKIGDPLGVALTWTDMADIYTQERKYKKALEYAQKSYDVLANHTDIKPTNHIAVLQTMAFALCNTGRCGKGVQIMEQVVEESKLAFGADSVSAAAQGFELGYLYWKNGDNVDASEWMARCLKREQADLSWGAPLYVNSMRQYDQFLHQTGQREEA